VPIICSFSSNFLSRDILVIMNSLICVEKITRQDTTDRICQRPEIPRKEKISALKILRLSEIHSVGPTLRSSHEQHFACSPPVSRLITFPPTSWLLLPWQASPPGKVRGDAANPLISRPGRLSTSETPIPLLVSSAVTHHFHHRPALPFRDWHPLTERC